MSSACVADGVYEDVLIENLENDSIGPNAGLSKLALYLTGFKCSGIAVRKSIQSAYRIPNAIRHVCCVGRAVLRDECVD